MQAARRVDAAGGFAFPLAAADVRLPEHMFPSAGGTAVAYDHPAATAGMLDPAKPDLAIVPLSERRAAPAEPRSRRWWLKLAASVVLHGAIAGSFLLMPQGEELALVEGGAASDVAALGSSEADAMAAGDAVNVEIMEMASLSPEAAPEATLSAIETMETLAPTTPETLNPIGELPRLDPTEATETLAPVEATTPAETAPVEVMQPQHEILAVKPVVPDSQLASVPPTPQMQPANTAEVQPAIPSEPERVAPVEPERAAPAQPQETATPTETQPAEEAVALAETVDAIPSPRPEPAKTRQAETGAPDRKVAEKRPEPRRTERQERADRPEKPRRASGSGGASQADARRGATDGAPEGSAASNKGGTTRSAAGNAAVSNYPGKVSSKLRRSVRYPAEARRNRLRGEVVVQFTVAGGGSVSGIRVARSSGSPVLDRAALDAVQRASPFPPIPSDAGRSSWPFTVPLSFTR